MALKNKTIEKILGIRADVDLTPAEMARNLKITFFPHKENLDNQILEFGKKLENAFKNLGVEIIPYDEALKFPSLKNLFKRFFLFFKIYSLVVEPLKSKKDIIEFRKSHYRNFFKFVFGKKIKAHENSRLIFRVFVWRGRGLDFR